MTQPQTKSPDKQAVRETAPAKINLALHVTGQRNDGYHLLDMLVTFARHGDVVTVTQSAEDSFTISGRFGAGLSADQDNLVIAARDGLADLMTQAGRTATPVHIHLEKNLPVASGIGGGSADAAATLRALMRLWDFVPRQADLDKLALSLGADVPMCLTGRPAFVRGIGEDIEAVDLPKFNIILINPQRPVSTPAVFRALETKTNPPLPERLASDWLSYFANARNDLQAPAIQLEPLIDAALQALEASGATLARMSGSGATCFGIYPNEKSADAAFALLEGDHPDWYLLRTETISP